MTNYDTYIKFCHILHFQHFALEYHFVQNQLPYNKNLIFTNIYTKVRISYGDSYSCLQFVKGIKVKIKLSIQILITAGSLERAIINYIRIFLFPIKVQFV